MTKSGYFTTIMTRSKISSAITFATNEKTLVAWSGLRIQQLLGFVRFAHSAKIASLSLGNFEKPQSVNSSVFEHPTTVAETLPSQPARTLYQDLKKAGIPKQTAKGVVDFHAARTAYINLLFEDPELTIKDAQELARHSSADLTMNIYGRANEKRMAKAIERLAEKVKPQKKCGIYVGKRAVGAEQEIATPPMKQKVAIQ